MKVDIRDQEMRELQACAAGNLTTSGSQPAIHAAGPSLSTAFSGSDAGGGGRVANYNTSCVAALDAEGGGEGNNTTSGISGNSGISGISGISGMELLMQLKECWSIGELQEVRFWSILVYLSPKMIISIVFIPIWSRGRWSVTSLVTRTKYIC